MLLGLTLGACSSSFVAVGLQAADMVKSSTEDMLELYCVLGKGAWGTVYKGEWSAQPRKK